MVSSKWFVFELIDDIGTTLLHIAQLNPERYGYSGRVCDFLVDRS